MMRILSLYDQHIHLCVTTISLVWAESGHMEIKKKIPLQPHHEICWLGKNSSLTGPV